MSYQASSSKKASSKKASSKEASSKEKSPNWMQVKVIFHREENGRCGSPIFEPPYFHLLDDWRCPARNLDDGEECEMTFQIHLDYEQCALLEESGAVKVDGTVILDILKKNNKNNDFDFVLKYNTGLYGSDYSEILPGSLRLFKEFKF
jgi:hypothetical protein